MHKHRSAQCQLYLWSIPQLSTQDAGWRGLCAVLCQPLTPCCFSPPGRQRGNQFALRFQVDHLPEGQLDLCRPRHQGQLQLAARCLLCPGEQLEGIQSLRALHQHLVRGFAGRGGAGSPCFQPCVLSGRHVAGKLPEWTRGSKVSTRAAMPQVMASASLTLSALLPPGEALLCVSTPSGTLTTCFGPPNSKATTVPTQRSSLGR